MRLLILLPTFLLVGCLETTRTIRAIEYSAETPVWESATLGGCTVETTDEQVSGRLSLTYKGQNCEIHYSTNPE